MERYFTSLHKVVLFFLHLFIVASLYSQNVNISCKINGFRHNRDCGDDGVDDANIFGTYKPEPRWCDTKFTVFDLASKKCLRK